MTTAISSALGERALDPDTYANGDPATFGLPLDLYERLRHEEPCTLVRFDDPRLIDAVWLVSRYADIEAIDRDPETWAADRGHVNIWRNTPVDPHVPGGKPAIITMDGEDHRRNRRVISRAFTPKAVAALEPKFKLYARQVVDAALEQGTFDFVDALAYAMPREALGDVIGVPQADRAKFFAWVDIFASPFDPRIAASQESVMEAMRR